MDEGVHPVSRRTKQTINWKRMAEIEPVPMKWLWEPFVPIGGLTLLEGDPGMGKSWITCSIAAHVSRGLPLPGQDPRHPGNVLMLSAEDSLDAVMRPRFDKMDADLDRIFVSDDNFTLDKSSLVRLRGKIEDCAATIVFIDPLVAYMSAKVDTYKQSEVYGALGELRDLASDTGSAIIVVRHLRKGGDSGNAKYGGMGSIGFVGAARSGLVVRENTLGERYLLNYKNNYAREGMTLRYGMTDDGTFEWLGTPRYDEPSARNVRASKAHAVSLTPKKQDDIALWIAERLAGGPVLASTIHAEAEERGFNERTLTRAKTTAAHSYKAKDGWWWAPLSMNGVDFARWHASIHTSAGGAK